MDWTDEQVEASRADLGIPQDWEIFSCSGCDGPVWVPPIVGDLPMTILCGDMACMLKVLTGGRE